MFATWILTGLVSMFSAALALAAEPAPKVEAVDKANKPTEVDKTKKPVRKKPIKDTTSTPEGSREKTDVANVFTEGKAMHLALEYAVSMRGSDRGLEHVEGEPTPSKTNELGLRALRLEINGEFAANADYALGLDPALTEDPVAYAYATWWITPNFGLLAGKDLVAQGGFERMHEGYETIMLSPYNESYLPLAVSEAMFAAKLKFLGELKLQIVQDQLRPKVTAADSATDATTEAEQEPTKQPAIAFEWAGVIKTMRPILQAGSYDFGRSKYVDVGLGIELTALSVYVDYLMDLRTEFAANPTTGDLEKLVAEHTLIAFESHLHFGKANEMFLTVTDYAVKQPEDSTLGLKDHGYNTTSTTGLTLDDNATIATLGVRLGAVAKAFRPFLALTSRQARFLDPTDPSVTVERSDLGYEIGVAGAM